MILFYDNIICKIRASFLTKFLFEIVSTFFKNSLSAICAVWLCRFFPTNFPFPHNTYLKKNFK